MYAEEFDAVGVVEFVNVLCVLYRWVVAIEAGLVSV